MAKLGNLIKMTTATTGTGTITLGSAVAGFLTLAQGGITDGQTVSYAIKDGVDSEVGRGVYTSSGTTLTRSVLKSTNANAAINLSGTAQVIVTALAEDLPSVILTTQGDLMYHNSTEPTRLAAGTAGYLLQTGGSGANPSWAAPSLFAAFNAPLNLSLAVSAASSALTIAIKGANGNDPSDTNPVYVPFRSATGTTGTVTWREVRAASSLVISSGSTLGVTSSMAFRLWVVLFDDAGTLRLGVIKPLTYSNTTFIGSIVSVRPGSIASSTAEGGAGGADSAQVFYTGTAVTSKPYAVLGHLTWNATGVTAGTWTTTNLETVQVYGPGVALPGDTVQRRMTFTSSGSSLNSTTFTTVTDASFSAAATVAANLVKITWTAAALCTAAGAGTNSQIIHQMRANSSAINTNHTIGVASASGINAQTNAPINMFGFFLPNSTSALTYDIQHKGLNTATVTTSSITGLWEEFAA